MRKEEKELFGSLAKLSIPPTHLTVGFANLIASHNEFRQLIEHRRLPTEGWSDVQIQHFLFILATLDTNHKRPLQGQQFVVSSTTNSAPRWCGVGEREGRVYSSLVSQRHFGLAHGIGRSGDITEPQPKAVGSTVLAQLTLILTLDAMRRGSGLHPTKTATYGIVLPLCTGMSMALVLQSLRELAVARASAPTGSRRKVATDTDMNSTCDQDLVLWSRIDQKSCLKAISSAGLQCVVIPTRRAATLQKSEDECNDQVITDLEALQSALEEHNGRILAVVTTTSCFAPRVRDQIDEVAKLCQEANVYHIINNAYGLQCSITSKLINRACVVGRVDAIVCSTDKNFLVPVGT